MKIFFLFSLEFLQLKELSTEKKKQKPDQSKDPTKASKVAKVLEYPDETKTVAIENLEELLKKAEQVQRNNLPC